jgi:predicted transcriptional regulator of viral defense system
MIIILACSKQAGAVNVANENLRSALSKNGGIISVRQSRGAGVSHIQLLRGMQAGELERVSRGVYMSPDELDDVMYIAQLRRPKIVFSHDSALLLHGLTDRYPLSHTVTVPTGYNVKPLTNDGFTTFSVKRSLYEQDVIQIKSPLGHSVNAYDLERTIVDCVRSRNRMDAEIVTEAVKRYAGRTDKNLGSLMDIAEQFGVTKFIRAYMEVLL